MWLPSRRILLSALLALLPLPAIAAEAPPFTLDALLPTIDLAAERGAVSYRQTRQSGLLSEPITTHGTIRYRAPGYLRKTMARPDGQRVVVIADGQVRLREGGETHSRALDQMPGLHALMGILQAIAAGDADTLRQRYQARLTGSRADWALQLADGRTRTVGGTIGRDRGPGSERQPSPTRVVLTGGERVEHIALESLAFGTIRITLQTAPQTTTQEPAG